MCSNNSFQKTLEFSQIIQTAYFNIKPHVVDINRRDMQPFVFMSICLNVFYQIVVIRNKKVLISVSDAALSHCRSTPGVAQLWLGRF